MKPSQLKRAGGVLLAAVGVSGCSIAQSPLSLTGTDVATVAVSAAAIAIAAAIAASRRRLERELQKRTKSLQLSEERHRLLLEQASDAILVMDADTGVILEANRCACQLLGFQEQELVGRRHSILHPESQRHVLRARLADGVKRGEIVEHETAVEHRSGEMIPVQVRATVITTGAKRYLQAILRDLRPRLQSEAAMRQSEARNRQLFEHAPVAILETDFSGVGEWLAGLRAKGISNLDDYLAANPQELVQAFTRVKVGRANSAALRATGAPDFETFIASVGPSIVENRDLTAFRRQVDAIWFGRGEVVSDVTFARVDGSRGHGVMHWSAPRVDGRLDLVHTVLVVSDLSQLKAAEARLREVEDRWQLAVQALNVGIFEKNYLTGEVYLSDRWKGMLGFKPDELPDSGDEWQARIHPTDRQRVVTELQSHLRGENDLYRVEYRMQCRDGSYKWIASCGRAIFDSVGHPQRFIGAHMDISERKAAEDALRDSEARYRRLFEDNPNPMWVYDRETYRFLAVNQAALRQYGYSAEEFHNLTIFDIRPAEEREKLRQHIAGWSEGFSTGLVWKHSHKSGRQMFMRVRSHPHEFAGRPAMLALAEDVTERHEAEQRLRESERRYRDLFENAAEGVYQTSADGKFLTANPALARMLGYENAKHLMSAISSAAIEFYVDPHRREEFFRLLGDGDSVTGFESEVRCADGSTKWISENVRAIRGDQGELRLLEGFVSDITERRQSEAAIRASEERYRVLFEHSPVAILEYDYRKVGEWIGRLRAAGVQDLSSYRKDRQAELKSVVDQVTVVGVNEEAVRLVRASSKKELMENLSRIFSAEGEGMREQALQAVWEGWQKIEGEITLQALDGSSRRTYFRWWLPRLDSKESLEWTQVVLVDLTAVRSVEAELAAERERLRVTLRAMAEGLMTTDTAGVVQFMNEAAERITGWTAGAAIGREINQVCVLKHEKSRAAVEIPYSRAISEHRVVDFPLQTTVVSRQGTSCLVDGRCAPMHDVSGRAIGAVVVFRDVTERARLEAELLRSSKLEAVGILAGGIAHDFNNILTVVMGNVTLAMLDSVVMEAAGRWLTEAERGVMRARDLTQQLLTFAKGGAPVRKAVHLPEVVREAAEFALHGSKVRCEFTQEPDLWAADVDKGQIGQVVQNLVINAVQAMPEGGIVRICMRNDHVPAESPRPLAIGDYLYLSFADTGTGIRAEHLARIFDPYFTTKQSGSGLGLATVYSIIRKHQGHIEVESELGKGTTFHIWLPAAREALVEPKEAPEKLEPLSGRVLFMDDEETIRAMAAILLKRLGLEVVAVGDGEAAVSSYREALEAQKPFKLVIMDLTVPGGMGGKEAMQELLKIDRNVKAIVSSGYSSDPVLSDYRAHGFRGVVPKPYRFSDLARTIRAVMTETV